MKKNMILFLYPLSWVLCLISRAVFSAPSNDWGKPPTKRRVKTRHTFNDIACLATLQLKAYLFSAAIALCFSAISVNADVIICDGVLGNSGEQGASLVRFDGAGTSGMGIVCDRYGSLWDRGGAALNRYAVDGRLLASYKLPKTNADRNSDAVALAGDTLIIRMGGQLYSLPVDAPAGSEVQPMKIEATKMSFSSKDGWVLAAKGPEVFLVNAKGEKKPVATLKKNPDGVEFGPDGSICAILEWKVYKVVPEAADKVELIAGAPGERSQYLNGSWYGSAWHSTLRRFDKELKPSPGVVLGGNSGSFIGHVAEQSEIVNGRGLAQINPNLFAISGFGGVIHLLEWIGADKRFEPVRRIGALQSCGALALDREGRTWCVSGNWDWNDGPSTPQRWGVPVPEKVFGMAMMDSGSICGYGIMWGKPMVMFGKMDKEVRLGRIEAQTALPKEAVAVAVTEMNKKRVLLILEANGKLTAANINGDGSYNSDGAAVQLITATPVKEWTSLASSGKDMLIGAGDGYVIELARDGEGWKEKRRWNSFGQDNADKFGASIWLALDSGRLWVSDKMRNRVVCFDLSSGKQLATYGVADTAGSEITKMNSPAVIAADGKRAVLYDSGNQRILKLELQESK
ncbi:MAG TPA: hypothetical protein DET40_23300 [Lentisphaeria bacterium]|nr:MAG: hypothetical protein A2X45_24625 [Lentisphaerae bacterium GWF2_50_93]HCE46482.1 hypothetical protein [Lentisphaeria bacterium]